MSLLLQAFPGILAALGGFVEAGELIFSVRAGAKFGFSLLWIVALGTLGIILYGEMAGRVAAVTKQPIFDWVRERAGFRMGLSTLLAANLVSLLICAAEIGGIAIVLRLMFGGSYRLLAILAFLLLLGCVWFLAFRRIERLFGFLGLLMLVFLIAAIQLRPDWHAVAAGVVPNVPRVESPKDYLVYAYFAVTLLSSIMLPHQAYVDASGAIEDGWKPFEIPMNRAVVTVGFALGSLLAAALVVVGAQFMKPLGIDPRWPGAAALGPAFTMGRMGLAVALLGMLFAFGGAAVKNALAGAYNTAQFLGWPWGKWRKPSGAPRFALAWIVMLTLAVLVLLAGVNPVQVVEYSIVFSVLILPLTYLPLLMTAGDRRVMGAYVNNRATMFAGWFFLGILTLAGLAALPLLVITRGGKI
jgi:Mn2+/Fe2+ NRAMP family transporter